MRVLRSFTTAPTFPVAITSFPSLQLLDPEAALGGPGARAHLLSAFNAPPFKTFVELAKHAPETVAGRDVARGDLDRPFHDHFRVGEGDLLDPSPFLQQMGDAVEIVRPVLEGLLGHRRSDDRSLLEEQSVARMRHHALVQLHNLVELGLVDLDGPHGHGSHQRGLYICYQSSGGGSARHSPSVPSASVGEPPAASVDSSTARVVSRPVSTFGHASRRSSSTDGRPARAAARTSLQKRSPTYATRS